MKSNLWVEWIGIWGSGKTTSRNKVRKHFIQSGKSLVQTESFFLKKKHIKIFIFLKSIFITPTRSIRLFLLLFECYYKAKKSSNSIVIDEIRTFLVCYLARFNLTDKRKNDAVFLWEGEFHLLPILFKDKKSMEVVIDILLSFTRVDSCKFILMTIDKTIAMDRIVNDQLENNKKRFNNHQLKSIKKEIYEFELTQNLMVQILKDRGMIIYEHNSNYNELLKFIL